MMTELFEKVYKESKMKLLYVSTPHMYCSQSTDAYVDIIFKQGKYYAVSVYIDLDKELRAIPGTEHVDKDSIRRIKKSDMDLVKFCYTPDNYDKVDYEEEWTDTLMTAATPLLRDYKARQPRFSNLAQSSSYSSESVSDSDNDDFTFGTPMGHVLLNLM